MLSEIRPVVSVILRSGASTRLATTHPSTPETSVMIAKAIPDTVTTRCTSAERWLAYQLWFTARWWASAAWSVLPRRGTTEWTVRGNANRATSTSVTANSAAPQSKNRPL